MGQGASYGVDIADQIQTYLTMRANAPRVRERVYPGMGAVEIGLYSLNQEDQGLPPTVSQTETFQWSSSAADLDETVDLETGTPVGYSAIVVRNPPSELQRVRGIHGNEYSFTTSHHAYHPTAIESEQIDGNTALFRLVDTQTGEPVSGAELSIRNGERETATTDSDGEIWVQRDGNPISVQYDGTSLIEEQDVYLSSSVGSILLPIHLDFSQVVTDALRTLAAISIFLLFYIPLRIIRKEPEQ
jgi:hypothetical protein